MPHITLTQQFVPSESFDTLLAHVDQVVRVRARLRLRVTGGGSGSSSVWMSIARTPELVSLHEHLLQATEAFEVPTGDASAFFGEDARDRDVRWVREFRRESSFDRFTPHITLGHASEPPAVEPFDFVATTIAVCHLGRFCTCRRIIRAWDMSGEHASPRTSVRMRRPYKRICSLALRPCAHLLVLLAVGSVGVCAGAGRLPAVVPRA